MASAGTAGELEFQDRMALNRLDLPGRLRGIGYGRVVGGVGAGGAFVTLSIDETGRAGRLISVGLLHGPPGSGRHRTR